MKSIALDKAESTGLLPQVLASRAVLNAPPEAFDHCAKSLVSSGVLSKVGAQSHQFRWGSDPAFAKLDHKQANAVYILCVAESLKILKGGATQAALDKLVQASRVPKPSTLTTTPPTTTTPLTTTATATPWVLAAAGAAVLGGIYIATRKRRH
jgi:hypothetical protein